MQCVRQSARIAYLSWKIEIGRDWYRSQIGRRLWAKVEMCTPVHGLSVCLIAEKPESPCTGVHIFTFAHKSRPIWLRYSTTLVRFRFSSLNKLVARTVRDDPKHVHYIGLHPHKLYARGGRRCQFSSPLNTSFLTSDISEPQNRNSDP